MILISHRGNFEGKNFNLENNPAYIDEALSKNYDVELDIWYISEKWYLGHDDPKYLVDINWLTKRKDKLWIHCKNFEALNKLNKFKNIFNYFWHEEDAFTITSKNFIWSHPKNLFLENSIAVCFDKIDKNIDYKKCIGICSDNFSDINKTINNIKN